MAIHLEICTTFHLTVFLKINLDDGKFNQNTEIKEMSMQN